MPMGMGPNSHEQWTSVQIKPYLVEEQFPLGNSFQEEITRNCLLFSSLEKQSHGWPFLQAPPQWTPCCTRTSPQWWQKPWVWPVAVTQLASKVSEFPKPLHSCMVALVGLLGRSVWLHNRRAGQGFGEHSFSDSLNSSSQDTGRPKATSWEM